MFKDIRNSIDSQSNFATALILNTYTEVLGGFVRGTLEKGESERNYEAFMLRMEYREEEAENYYDRVRCGLVHQYFIKDEASIGIRNISDKPRGIVEVNGVIYFGAETYFDEFKKAYFSYKDDLLNGVDNLAQNLDKVSKGERMPTEARRIYDPLESDNWIRDGGVLATSTYVAVSGSSFIFPSVFKAIDKPKPDDEKEGVAKSWNASKNKMDSNE